MSGQNICVRSGKNYGRRNTYRLDESGGFIMECIQSKKSGTIRYLIALWNIAYDGVRRYNLIKNALWLVYAIPDFLIDSFAAEGI